MTITTALSNSTTAATTADNGTSRTRRAGKIAAVALALSAGLGTIAGPALAESPPAPKPQFGLTDKSPGVNNHQVWDIKTTEGDTWADVTFLADTPGVIVQVGPNKPSWTGDHYTMGAVSPRYLKGTPVASNINGYSLGTNYRFTLPIDGLTPSSYAYVLFTVNGTAQQKPNQDMTTIKTKTRHVRMTPVKIHVSDDADHGLRGKGEISFGFRVAPDAGSLAPSIWGSSTSEVKLSSGADWTVPLGHGDTVNTKKSTVYVQIQGRENDDDGAFDYCAVEGGTVSPLQQSDNCYDESYAEALVQLPVGRYAGMHSQMAKAVVSRSPNLVFQVDVKVDTWFS